MAAERIVLLGGLAAIAVAAGAAPMQTGAQPTPRPSSAASRAGDADSATPGLPARMLRVELRCVPAGASPLSGSTPELRPGSVVVGTAGRVDPGPVSTVRSGSAQREALPVLQVLVANGERAAVSWQQTAQSADPAWTLDAILATPASPGTGASATALLRRNSRVSMRQLEVAPRWTGGGQPVRLWVAAMQSPQPSSATEAGAPAGFSLQTQLLLPLDRWVLLARSPGGAAPAAAQEWQVRVSLQPE